MEEQPERRETQSENDQLGTETGNDRLGTESGNENDDENPLEPDQVKDLLGDLRKKMYRHTFRSMRADHHHEFLLSCRSYNRFPAGLSVHLKVNVMDGSRKAALHAAVDDILQWTTLTLVETLSDYYDSLTLEETRLGEVATTTYKNLLREYPACANPSDAGFIEELDAKTD